MDTDKKTVEIGRNAEGKFIEGNSGGPGRPQGMKNRFSIIKDDMLQIWVEENGKEKFRKLFVDEKTFPKALEKILSLCPREMMGDQHNQGFSIIPSITVDGAELQFNVGKILQSNKKEM